MEDYVDASRERHLKSLETLIIATMTAMVTNVWFVLVLWHINHCRLSKPNPFYIYINSSISNNSVIRIAFVFTVECQKSSVSNNSVSH